MRVTATYQLAAIPGSYQDLTPAEKDERMKNLHLALKVSNQKVKRLQAKVENLTTNQNVCL